MGNAIVVAVLVVICIFAVISYRKRLSGGGCCGSGGGIIKIEPENKNTKSYAHKIKVYIDGMHCENCAARIENAFNELGGCYAKANVKKGYADVWSNDVLNEQKTKDLIEDKGYGFKSMIVEK